MSRYVDISELDIPSDDCSYDELMRFVEAVCESEYIGDIDLADDGTLSVKIDDATRVTRVFVEDGKNGDLYYTDGGDYEWCHDCKEYDTEKHCCPRWNKVIRQALAEIEADRWIPCSERMPSEKEWVESYIRDKRASEFIVMIKGASRPTTLYLSRDNYWFDENRNFYEVIAWMPLPKSYERSRR